MNDQDRKNGQGSPREIPTKEYPNPSDDKPHDNE